MTAMWGADRDSKYRSTWQFERALEIISPAPQQRADCERHIVEALMAVEIAREIHSRRTPAEVRKLLEKLAKALHAAIDLAEQLRPYDLWGLPAEDAILSRIGNLKKCLEEVEAAADYIDKNEVGKGAPRYNQVSRARTSVT